MYNYRFIKGKQGPYDKWKNLFYGHSERAFPERARRVSAGAVRPRSSQAVPGDGGVGRLRCPVLLLAQGMVYLGMAEEGTTGEDGVKSLGSVWGEKGLPGWNWVVRTGSEPGFSTTVIVPVQRPGLEDPGGLPNSVPLPLMLGMVLPPSPLLSPLTRHLLPLDVPLLPWPSGLASAGGQW